MPAYIPQPLADIATQVQEGQTPLIAVRTLLSWFYGSQRRGRWIVSIIREALDELNLKTDPDFDWVHLDAFVSIIPKTGISAEVESTVTLDTQCTAEVEVAERLSQPYRDPTFRIGRLDLANRAPRSVAPTTTVDEAVTVMLQNDFSQLPVMRSERDVKGLFSWKSLGEKKHFGTNIQTVSEAMDECQMVTVDSSLFDVLPLIRQNDCVLIKDGAQKICGIITAFDISATFGQLGEPFLLLDEIENHIRWLISGVFTRPEVAAVRDPASTGRVVENISDLTLGEYLRLLENPERWQRIQLQIDRATFIEELRQVAKIRNEVMHFDPEGLEDKDLTKLREFAIFLRKIQRLRTIPAVKVATTES